MKLDAILTGIGLKTKNLFVLDLGFPRQTLREFASAYPHRYIHAPLKTSIALDFASGMASMGKLVLIIPYENLNEANLNPVLNIKIIRRDESAKWENFETSLKAFGSANLLIPHDE